MNVHIWQLLPKRFHIQTLHRSKTKHIFVAATEQLKLFFCILLRPWKLQDKRILRQGFALWHF